jgi:hypothetical protein
MLDIRDARDAVDSPEQKRESEELEKKQKTHERRLRLSRRRAECPKKDGGSGESKTAALRNAHSVMDIASLSRSEDHEASSRVEAGGKKEAALGVDAKKRRRVAVADVGIVAIVADHLRASVRADGGGDGHVRGGVPKESRGLFQENVGCCFGCCFRR